MNIYVETLLLFTAGFFGGVLNSIAGGGSFVTFPALLLAGVPPISANATNTFSSCSGYLSGAYALREELRRHKSELPGYVLISLFGGIAGAWLLMRTPAALFQDAIPWLLLFATLLFILGQHLNKALRRLATRHRHASAIGHLLLSLLLLAVCLYGGFFNAGLGIVILSYLALAGHTDINAMNGLKLLISSCVSLVAIALFIHEGAIAWREGIMVLSGTMAGGYMAARLSRQLAQAHVRALVILLSSGITVYFFHDSYWS